MRISAAVLLQLLVASAVAGYKYSAFSSQRIPKANLKFVSKTDSLCTCIQFCRVLESCRGVSYGTLYTLTTADISPGDPGVCHITVKPHLPNALETKAGYQTLLVGRVESGCETVYGFENTGPAGCVFVADAIARRSAAVDACEAIGGVLASLATEEQLHAVVKALKREGSRPARYWVSASKASAIWTWQTGAVVSDDFWGPDQPDLGAYAVMDSSMDFKLSSTNDREYRFVCQKQVNFP